MGNENEVATFRRNLPEEVVQHLVNVYTEGAATALLHLLQTGHGYSFAAISGAGGEDVGVVVVALDPASARKLVEFVRACGPSTIHAVGDDA